MKAGVKKGTGLIIIGDLELHPFVHQKGKNQGKPNSGPSVVVKDWQFAPLTYDDENGDHPGVPGGVPQNGYGQPGGAPVPISRADTRHPHREAIHRHPVLLPAIMHLQAPHHRTEWICTGEDTGKNKCSTGERTAERLQTAPERLCSESWKRTELRTGQSEPAAFRRLCSWKRGSSGNTGRLSGRWIYPGYRTAG